MLIKETQAVLHQKMDEVLRPLGLSVPQYACLQALQDAPGINGSELARRMFVSRQSMNVLVQGLEKRGLIERVEDPGPRRERATTLTPQAAALLAQARSAVANTAATMTCALSPNECAQLQTLLASCRDSLLNS